MQVSVENKRNALFAQKSVKATNDSDNDNNGSFDSLIPELLLS